jgi:tetratricopeptide (TPR) repeat protein
MTDNSEVLTMDRKALRDSPEVLTSSGWNDRGALLLQSGQTDRAADCFKKACLANPRNFNALENLIELFIRMEKHAPAAALASQWTRSHPRCARAWIAWAKLTLLAGQFAAARAALATALEIDPANAAVRNALNSLQSEQDADADSTPHSALHTSNSALPGLSEVEGRTPHSDSPLPFLRPLSPASTAPVKNDPPVLCV